MAVLLNNNPVLTSLDVSNNRIGDAGAASIAEGLEHNMMLEDVSYVVVVCAAPR